MNTVIGVFTTLFSPPPKCGSGVRTRRTESSMNGLLLDGQNVIRQSKTDSTALSRLGTFGLTPGL